MPQESFSQVSTPNSPGRGTVLKLHRRRPVRTSNACTSPLVLLCVFGAGASAKVPPTMTTSRATVGVACSPISPVTRSIDRPSAMIAAALRSTRPSRPKPGTRCPVLASSATTARRVPPVAYSTPPAITGVPSSLNSGPGPRLSVLKRQAISSSPKFEASIWSSGE